MARGRGRTALGGTVVLDADGVSKAATADRRVQAMLVALRQPGPVLLVTSELSPMARLTASQSDIAVVVV